MEKKYSQPVETYFQHLLLLYKITQRLKQYSYFIDEERYNDQVFILNETANVIQQVINSLNNDDFETHKYTVTNKKHTTSVIITITTTDEVDNKIQFLTKIRIGETCSMLLSCDELEIEFIKHIIKFQKDYLVPSIKNVDKYNTFTTSCFFLFKYNLFVSNSTKIQEQIYVTPCKIIDKFKDDKKEVIQAIANQLIRPITDKYLIDYDKNMISLSTQIDNGLYEQDCTISISFDDNGILDKRKLRYEIGKVINYYKRQIINYENLISEKFIS